ncbi:MAG: hypothetical protein H6618_10120 [Deltaproteobacteria bacterium]|nr:hypothetical protein [Deltaproteobacteria bacterium]
MISLSCDKWLLTLTTILSVILLNLLLVRNPLYSRDSGPAEGEIRRLTDLNTQSPTEPSWPHTGAGLLFGAGISKVSPSKKNTQTPEKDLLLQRWSLSGSLFYPLDMGLGFGKFTREPDQGRAGLVHGWLQWTAWEEFGWPALAFRLGHSRLYGLSNTEIRTWTGNSQISWGYRRLTAWIGSSASFHQIFGQLSESEPETDLTIDKHETAQPQQAGYQQSFSLHALIGAHLQLIPDLLNIAVERQHSRNQQTITFKVSLIL